MLEKKIRIQVIDRIYSLLDILATHPQAMSLKDLSQTSNLHPSTVHRILNDLVVGRFVERTNPGSYQLGLRFLELGNAVKSRFDVRHAALEPMRELSQQIGQLVSLSLRQGDAIVYIERAYSERSGMQVIRAIGGQAPLHLTSVGKLFLAQQSSTQIKDYVERTGLKATTVNSIRTQIALEKELRLVRKTGAAYDQEELELGVRCMASGIYNDHGDLIAGLSISAPSTRMKLEWMQQLQATTVKISTQLGFVAH